MKYFLSSIVLLGAILIGGFAHGQNVNNIERIEKFRTEISVNLDNSINVSDSLIYNSGNQNRHGIYRDIYPYSSEGRLMSISDISVTDEKGVPHRWVQQNSGSSIRLKIGDANVTFVGQKIYNIKYKASNAVAHFTDHDEIYWNVTGNEWLMPILSTEALIYLPDNINAIQSACYFGKRGSSQSCGLHSTSTIANSYGHPGIFTTGYLSAGEGMTIALGFPKGVLPEYPAGSVPEKSAPTREDPLVILFLKILPILAVVIPLIIFIIMFAYWNKHGRDPKGRGTIIPEYDVPDDLTPLQVKMIVNQKISPSDISAEIIYLATKGYIKIRQTESKILGLFKTTDYEFIKLKEFPDVQNRFDKIILDGIFKAGAETRSLKDMKQEFYAVIPEIKAALRESMLSEGYYSHIPKYGSVSSTSYSNSGFASILIRPLLMFAFLVAYSVSSLANLITGFSPIFAIISIAISIVIVVIFMILMPAKTLQGVVIKEYLLGLKDYMQIAEKDRMEFHNAPEKKPELFEKLLPYAMVLGVSAIWAKEFADLYMTPPSWYEGNSGVFNAVVFNNSLSQFNTMAAGSLASAPGGSGGSGGGGFSGGGGGGGGGGGW